MLGLFISKQSKSKMIKKIILISIIVLGSIIIYKSLSSSVISVNRLPEKQYKKRSLPKEKIKKTSPTYSKKSSPPQTPHSFTRSSNSLEPKDQHIARTDNKGKIYPRTIAVDEDMLIAYGDLIVGNTDDLDAYQNGDKTLDIPPPQLWPSGSIPYVIDKSITADNPIQADTIKKVINSLNEWANLKIHPRQKDENNYVLFKKGTQHCYANIGFRLGETRVSLSPGCGVKEIFHEFFHVLGFFHEQNREDRDNFIEVLWENIDEENWPQFEKFSTKSSPQAFQDLDAIAFEFNSIMLYDSHAFSNNSDYSMVRTDGTPFNIPFQHPTQTDLDRLHKLYPIMQNATKK